MQTTNPTPVATGRSAWKIDPTHTDVAFAVKHLMISKVRGRFADVRGAIELDDEDVSGSFVDVEIDAASIDTREEQRDAHLRAPDFLDVENYPTIRFRSRRVEGPDRERLRLVGDLTIRGETREVELDVIDEGSVTDPWGNERKAFSGSTTIDRRDFGLTWNQALETGGILVGNEVTIGLEIQAIKNAA
jgi:polyisoprenoid-binding protein YceI